MLVPESEKIYKTFHKGLQLSFLSFSSSTTDTDSQHFTQQAIHKAFTYHKSFINFYFVRSPSSLTPSKDSESGSFLHHF